MPIRQYGSKAELVYCCMIVSPIRAFGLNDAQSAQNYGISVNSSLLCDVLQTFLQRPSILIHAYFEDCFDVGDDILYNILEGNIYCFSHCSYDSILVCKVYKVYDHFSYHHAKGMKKQINI